MALAVRLARLDPVDGLHYRTLPLEAVIIDVIPCRGTAADVFYRFFRLRPLGPAVSGPGRPVELPEEWSSEAVSMPRRPHKGVYDKLTGFETDFAVYTLLRRVEREIDEHLRCGRRSTDGGGASPGCIGCG